jgi:hypothetical protein
MMPAAHRLDPSAITNRAREIDGTKGTGASRESLIAEFAGTLTQPTEELADRISLAAELLAPEELGPRGVLDRVFELAVLTPVAQELQHANSMMEFSQTVKPLGGPRSRFTSSSATPVLALGTDRKELLAQARLAGARIGRGGEYDNAEELLELAGDTNSHIRGCAYEALVGMGKLTAPALRGHIGLNPPPDQAKTLLSLLGDVGNASDVKRLVPYLDDAALGQTAGYALVRLVDREPDARTEATRSVEAAAKRHHENTDSDLGPILLKCLIWLHAPDTMLAPFRQSSNPASQAVAVQCAKVRHEKPR